MCGVSLNDSKRIVDLYSLLGVQNMADVVRHDTDGWGIWSVYECGIHVDDWVLTCKKVDVAVGFTAPSDEFDDGLWCRKNRRSDWRYLTTSSL